MSALGTVGEKHRRGLAALLGGLALGAGSCPAATATDTAVLEELQSLRAANRMLLRMVERQGAKLREFEERFGERGAESTPATGGRGAPQGRGPEERPQLLGEVAPDPKPAIAQKSGNAGAPFHAVPPAKSKPLSREVRFHPYGFLHLDVMADSAQAGVEEVLGFAASGSTPNASEGDLYASPKLSRFGATFDGPDQLGAKIDGKIEIDFYRELFLQDSRAVPRFRHAYVRLTWGDTALLVGQSFDIVAPLYPSTNKNFGLWNGGNPGDRRPGLRLDKKFGTAERGGVVQFLVGQAGSVAVSNDDEGWNFQSRLGLHRPFAGGTLKAGLWASHSEEGPQRRSGELYGLDLSLPLKGEDIVLRGELFQGKNADDLRAGVFQGTVNNRPVHTEGGWGELRFQLGSRDEMHVGFSVDNPEDNDLVVGTGNGSIARSQTRYLGWSRRLKPITLGLDVLNVQTDFVGNLPGELNRLHGYLKYDF